MKRILSYALAACFMLTACEVQNPVEAPEAPAAPSVSGGSSFGPSAKDSLIFSATLGADTKTYMENYGGGVYGLCWWETDRIILWDGNTLNDGSDAIFEECSIYEGACTTSATFLGTLQSDFYVALYANGYFYPQDGLPAIYLPVEQVRTREHNFADNTFPMIAVSSTRELYFENICSVLKLNVTGNGEVLSSVQVSSIAGEPLAGEANVSFDDVTYEPVLSFFVEEDNLILTDCYAELSDTPKDLYIVVPAQVYSEGLSFTLNATNGHYMTVSTAAGIETKRSQVHEIDINFENQQEDIWTLIGTMTEWSSDIEMTKADGYGWLLVNQYLEEGDEFKFRANGEWLLEFGYYNLSILYTEEGVEWFGQGTDFNGNLRALQSGYYDLLLDVENATLYVDLVGVEESFYGTIEEGTK